MDPLVIGCLYNDACVNINLTNWLKAWMVRSEISCCWKCLWPLGNIIHSFFQILVGHNLYLDLMLIYDKFIDHLPHTYKEYKEKLHASLPNIYDTKYISLQMRRVSGYCVNFLFVKTSIKFKICVYIKERNIFSHESLIIFICIKGCIYFEMNQCEK